MKIDFGPYPGPRAKKPRRMKMEFHDYDVWGLDHTLSMIIPPLLRKLKEKKHGIPGDMVEHQDDGDYSDEAFAAGEAKWDAIMDKMILAFELVRDEDEWEETLDIKKLDAYIAESNARRAVVDEGLQLFAKYFRSLWD